ncbi:MAG: CPBP family intramembrane metalloprotease [Gaiellaceae bacterium MAG52_C11]|nr:CPBP family intramembrane metalloprotease [Candidatus Gaiellasilicea maunaloa]
MTRRGLWLRVIAGVGAAVAALALVEVPSPTEAAVSLPAAMCLGLVGGVILFAALARQVPPLPTPRPAGRWLVRLTLVVAWAAVEEILWRWLALGVIAAAAGWPLALAASSLGFAAMHRVGKASQVATGATFGTVYLATGRLLAAVVAHATYNVVLAEALARIRPRAQPA